MSAIDPAPSAYRTGGLRYPPRHHREHAPVWIDAVLAALAHAPAFPAGGPIRLCDLGCGTGLGSLALAAADPRIRLTGIDLDPAHIDIAGTAAAAAGLAAEFRCADLTQFDPPAGSFDVILCHGLLSWVDDATRLAVARFVGKALAPGGVALLHYMSQPGGAAFAAFHQVFAAHADARDPVAAGLAVLRGMRDAQAGFFRLHPHASATLDSLLAEDPGYVAHEYLNPCFTPLAAGAVMALMRDAGLTYAGSATPCENIDALSLPGSCLPMVTAERDPARRETLKDLARNQALRIDLYRHPGTGLADAAHLARMRSIPWAAMTDAPRPGRLTFDTRIGPVEGAADIFGPLLTTLAAGPQPFGALERVQPFAGRPALLNQALQMLLWAGIAHPLRQDGMKADAAPFNRWAEAQRLPFRAAPRLGSALAPGRHVRL